VSSANDILELEKNFGFQSISDFGTLDKGHRNVTLKDVTLHSHKLFFPALITTFESVPHTWIEKSIEPLGVNNKIVKFCKLSMEK
jgi:hypothetical protein